MRQYGTQMPSTSSYHAYEVSCRVRAEECSPTPKIKKYYLLKSKGIHPKKWFPRLFPLERIQRSDCDNSIFTLSILYLTFA